MRSVPGATMFFLDPCGNALASAARQADSAHGSRDRAPAAR